MPPAGVENPSSDAGLPNQSSTPGHHNNAALPAASQALAGNEVTALRGLNKYILRDEVTSAEIWWALCCCMNHVSMSAGGKAVNLFPRTFPDSVIASKMEFSRQKIAYMNVYGLAKYFNDMLLEELKSCKDIVICFDESVNKVAQRQQMDIAVRFWNKETDEVSTRYLSSAFLGRTKATNLVFEFKAKVGDDLLKLLEMVSMDGPNVNFTFLKNLRADLQKNPDDPKLLLMGSCGLHVVHNAFKVGALKTGWNISLYLRSSYKLFK